MDFDYISYIIYHTSTGGAGGLGLRGAITRRRRRRNPPAKKRAYFASKKNLLATSYIERLKLKASL
jgi:hypothetical protein